MRCLKLRRCNMLCSYYDPYNEPYGSGWPDCRHPKVQKKNNNLPKLIKIETGKSFPEFCPLEEI